MPYWKYYGRKLTKTQAEHKWIKYLHAKKYDVQDQSIQEWLAATQNEQLGDCCILRDCEAVDKNLSQIEMKRWKKTYP